MFDKNSTGPKMQGILDRVPSDAWLRMYITNEDSQIAIGDTVALRIARWSPMKGNHQHTMSKANLDTLMHYITQ
jgi:hypothetical protein